MLARFPIRARIHLIGIIALLGLATITVLAVASLYLHMQAQRYASTRAQLDTALGIASHFAAEETAGRLTHAAAQATAMAAIKALRYGDGNYFWINDPAARVLMHPIKPELDGTDGARIKDTNGISPSSAPPK